MTQSTKMTREEVFAFALLGIIGNIVYVHTWIDDMTDRSSWLAAFLGILLLIPFAIWILYLGGTNKSSNIFDIVQSGMGKFQANTLRFLFILINIVLVVTQINMFTEMVHTVFLQMTPTWMIMLIAIIACTYFAQKGISVIAKCIVVLGLLGIANYFFCFLLALPANFNVKYVIPVFDTSLLGFIKGTVFITQVTSEYLLLLIVIVKSFSSSKKYVKWVAIGILISALIFSIAILIIIAMISPELAKRIAFGGVNASMIIQIGQFIHGLELFVFLTYQFIAFGKIMICIYCIWDSSKSILHNKGVKLQLIMIAGIISALSVMLNSYNKAYFIAVFIGQYALLPFVLLALILATISSYINRKKIGMKSS